MAGCRPFTDMELAVLERVFGGAYGARNRAQYVLGWRSGFRISELLSLRLGQIVREGEIVREVTVPRRLMKGGRGRTRDGKPRKVSTHGRTVLLHPQAREVLGIWVRELGKLGYMTPDCYVFQSRCGGNRPISRQQAWRELKRACELAHVDGRRVGTHSLRKSFARRVGRKLGGDLHKLQEALGHLDVNATVSYVETNRAEIEEAILNA